MFELVLVILLVGVGIVPILAMFREAARQSPVSELQTRAALLAAERMEELVRDRLDPGRGYDWIVAANYPVDGAIAGFPGFTRTTTIEPDTTISGAPIRRVRVTVANAGAAAVDLRTWFAEVAP
jgi:hypothetical protein